MRSEKDAAVPTISPPSKAPKVRSSSATLRSRATSSGVGKAPNATSVAWTHAS